MKENDKKKKVLEIAVLVLKIIDSVKLIYYLFTFLLNCVY